MSLHLFALVSIGPDMEDIEMEVDTPPASLSQSAGSRKHAITAFVSPTHAGTDAYSIDGLRA